MVRVEVFELCCLSVILCFLKSACTCHSIAFYTIFINVNVFKWLVCFLISYYLCSCGRVHLKSLISVLVFPSLDMHFLSFLAVNALLIQFF